MPEMPAYEDLVGRIKDLKAQIETFHSLFDHSACAILLTNPNGEIIYANKDTCRLFQRTEQEIIAGGRAMLVDESDPRLSLAIEERRRTGCFCGELNFKKADGTIFPGIISSTLFIDTDGQTRTSIIIRDVTAQKQAEEALQKNEKFLRLVIDSSPECIFVKDREGKYILVNDAISRLYGIPKDQILNRTDLELVGNSSLSREEAERFMAEDQIVIRKKQPKHIPEELVATADGKIRWFQTIKIPLFSDSMPDCILGIAVDITERKLAEQALRESEEQFSAYLEHAPDGVYMSDLEGHFLYGNRKCEEIIGFRREDLIGKNFLELNILPESSLAKAIHLLQVNKEGKPTGPDEIEIINREGRRVPLEITTRPVKYEGKSVVLAFVRDITERKRIEARIFQYKKAESLGRMAGAIAHQYNNLMMVVLGNLELAANNSANASMVAELVAEAMKAARRAAGVGQLILAYLGQAVSRRKPLDLSTACRDTLSGLTSSLHATSRIHNLFPSKPLSVLADAAQIKQLLTNLILNADDAIGDAEGDITITVTEMKATAIPAAGFFPTDWMPVNKSYGCFSVADTGCGLSMDDVERIFDPFYSTKFTGRGMGLSVALGIVKAHNGCITVESRPGAGSVFSVYLPLAKKPVPLPGKPAADPAPGFFR